MDRVPPIPPNELNEEQRALYDQMSTRYEAWFKDSFLYKRPQDGAFLGPMQHLLHTLPLAGPSVAFLEALAKLPGDLPPSAIEVAVLTVGAHYGAGYVLYAHTALGKLVGLSEAQIETIKQGEKPRDLGEKENLAYDVAAELLRRRGPLTGELWARGVDLLGRDGMLKLLNYVGSYASTCLVFNGCDVRAPEEEAAAASASTAAAE